jgi:hypothetical protein
VDRFGSAEEFLSFFKTCYGPTIATYRHIASDPEKVAALDQALIDLARRHGADTGRMDTGRARMHTRLSGGLSRGTPRSSGNSSERRPVPARRSVRAVQPISTRASACHASERPTGSRST